MFGLTNSIPGLNFGGGPGGSAQGGTFTGGSSNVSFGNQGGTADGKPGYVQPIGPGLTITQTSNGFLFLAAAVAAVFFVVKLVIARKV